MAARLEPFNDRIWALALAGLAASVGLLAGIDPRLAIAAALGVAFVVLVIADLTAGAIAFVLLSFLELLPTLGGSALSLPKIAGLLLAMSWLATVATRRGAIRDFFSEQGLLVAFAAAFLAWVALSVTWAQEHHAAVSAVSRFGLNIALLPIIYTAVRKRQDAIWITVAFIAGATVSAAYGLVAAPSVAASAGSALDRISGTIGDPNELAAVLVAGLMLSAAAVRLTSSPILRIGAIAAGTLCAVVIFLTLSRGGLVALGAALVAGVVLGGRSRPTYVLVTIAVTLAAFTYFGAIATQEARDRVQNADGGTGRTDIWRVAWRAFEDKPVQGLGADNFSSSSIHYLLRPGTLKRSDLIVLKQEVVHNMYLQVLSELGLIGLFFFGGIIVVSVGGALRASREFRNRGDPQMERLARAVAIASVGILAADFFLSGQFNKQLWLLLALGPALQGIAIHGESVGDQPS